MRKASVIEKESRQIETVEDLTGVFESIASIQVAKIKDKATMSEQFFQLLWQRYSSIRIDPASRITSSQRESNGRQAFVIISAEAGLSGDIDDRLIEEMLKDYQSDSTDIVVLGTHGANQLRDRRIPYIRYFQVPESDTYVDVGPLVAAVADYSKITIYYEEYVSLGVQNIKEIDLLSSIQAMSQSANNDENLITAEETIFEPSLDEIAGIMERGMMSLAFSQAILESGLAQAASRFNAMASAKKRAFELLAFQKLEYHRAKRADSDRRLHEVLIGIKKKRQRQGAKR